MRCSPRDFLSFALLLSTGVAFGQAPASTSTEVVPTPVTVDREALTLRAPDAYRIPLVLRAQRRVAVASQMSGVISDVFAEPGKRLSTQVEVARIDAQERQLELEQAQALMRLAQAQQAAASSAEQAIAKERTAAAQSALKLAELRLAATQVRTPFDGIVTRVFVQPGMYVDAGDSIVELVDPSMLTAVIPIERNSVKVGDELTLQVENGVASGQIQAIIPATPDMEPLRDLFVSLAAAQVTINNAGGQWAAGQSIISTMIPRHPIAEIPNRAVLNSEGGERKVQVLREGFVRDLPIQLLGQVGETHVFVSARFQPDDELMAASSEPLVDGSWLRAKLNTPAGTAPGTNPSGAPTPRPVQPPTSNF